MMNDLMLNDKSANKKMYEVIKNTFNDYDCQEIIRYIDDYVTPLLVVLKNRLNKTIGLMYFNCSKTSDCMLVKFRYNQGLSPVAYEYDSLFTHIYYLNKEKYPFKKYSCSTIDIENRIRSFSEMQENSRTIEFVVDYSIFITIIESLTYNRRYILEKDE